MLTSFLGDMSKGLMLGAIVGQWSIPGMDNSYRILMSVTWFVWALLSLYFAISLAKHE